MEFRELSDKQWKFIRPHLPPQSILFVLITGCRWGDMPAIYVPRQLPGEG